MIEKIMRKSVDIIPFNLRDKIKDIPFLKKIQQQLFFKYLENQNFIHKITGGPAKGLVYPIQMPMDKLIWTGTWESEFSKTLVQYTKKGDVCYDIGGYRGFYTGVMAMNGAKEVFVFEPLPNNIQQIEKVISLNSKSKIKLIKNAISEETGNAVFELMPYDSMGKLSSSEFQKTTRGNHTINVTVETIDNLVTNNIINPPNLIKIDVEGVEETVLKGGKATLKKYNPILLIEIHSHEIGKKCYSILKEIGYNVKVVGSNKNPDFQSEEKVCHYLCLPNRKQ